MSEAEKLQRNDALAQLFIAALSSSAIKGTDSLKVISALIPMIRHSK